MKQTVNGVRAMLVVETGSDHHLVLIKVKLMKRAHTKGLIPECRCITKYSKHIQGEQI